MTGRVLRWGVGVGLAAALPLAGCSNSTAGTPAPASTDGSATSSAQPALDAETYRSKPCELLPAELPQSLGYSGAGTPVTAGKNVDLTTGQSCTWNDFSGGKAKSIQVQILPKNSTPSFPGLASVFHNRELGLIAYAEPTDVLGYQAVFADTTDSRPNGKCAISVAISDNQLISADADGYQGADDSCDTAKQLAEAMIKTLGGS